MLNMENYINIDPSKSFLQNIMTIAKNKGIAPITISRIINVKNSNLSLDRLAINPYPGFGLVSFEAAENLIDFILPQYSHEYFRTLKGFPEKTMDILLKDFSYNNPQLENIKGKKFGELVRFYRKECEINGKYLTIPDCVCEEEYMIKPVGTDTLSRLERCRTDIWQSQGFAILKKLGYSADIEGLKEFVLTNSKMIDEYKIRKEKFGNALFIHIYPDGKTNIAEKDVDQNTICSALKIAPKKIRKIFESKFIPPASSIGKVFKLFGYEGENAENEFYSAAEIMLKKIDGQIELNYRPISQKMANFGRIIKIVRDELGVSQLEISNLLYNQNTDPVNTVYNLIDDLEQSRRVIDISQSEQNLIISALGFNKIEDLEIFSEKAKVVQNIRKKHFNLALNKIAGRQDENSAAIIENILAAKKSSSTSNFAPYAARKALDAIGINEIELYQRAGIELSQSEISTINEVSEFIADFNYAKFTAQTPHVNRLHVGKTKLVKSH